MYQFNKILTTMMPSRLAIKRVLSSELKNVGQGHHLHKSLYLGYYTTDFYQTFLKMIALLPAENKSYQLTLKMLVKVTI